MNIAGEGSEKVNVLNMFFVVEDCLIEVADTPTERYVVVEEFAEFCCSLACVGVTPCAERYENFVALEWHITVHHGTETNCGQTFNLDLILFKNILAEVSIAILKTIPDSLDAICPQSVNQLVFPSVAALSYRLVLLIDENCLYSGRAELDSEYGFTLLNYLFCPHNYQL